MFADNNVNNFWHKELPFCLRLLIHVFDASTRPPNDTCKAKMCRSWSLIVWSWRMTKPNFSW